MRDDDSPGHTAANDSSGPENLGHAGAIIDKAVEYMTSQNIDQLTIASALLGGAMGMLARSMNDDAILQVLHNAIASVRSGDLRRMDH